MSRYGSIPWKALETHAAVLFLLGGLVQTINITLQILTRLGSLGIPEIARDVTLAVALILALLGLLGLAPGVRESYPRLTRAGSIFAGLGILGLLAVAIGEPILQGDEPPAWFAPVVLFYILGVPLSFLIFSIVTLRSNEGSRLTGVLLLVVFGAFLFFLHLIPIDVGRLLAQIPSLVIAAGFLALGYRRHVDSVSTDATGEVQDPMAG